MSAFTFMPATREQAKARIALQGPGGSGKTKSALRLAEGLAQGGLIGVVDTERGSALKYAPVPGRPDLGGHEFVHLPLAICSPENLIAAVQAAEQARIAALLIDSWSHFWAGKGGLLARVDQESRKPGHYGGSYTAWAPVNSLEQDMLDALLNFPGHVILTMRTKNDYLMEGKTVTKVGVKTVQREGAEYEVDVVIDMIQGTGTVTKTRYEPLNDLTVHHPSQELGEIILEQLGQGVDVVQEILNAIASPTLTYSEARDLHSKAQRRGLLKTPAAHPSTGDHLPLGQIILEYGTALKPAAVGETPPATPVQSAPQQTTRSRRADPGPWDTGQPPAASGPSDHELAKASASGYSAVEQEAQAEMDRRQALDQLRAAATAAGLTPSDLDEGFTAQYGHASAEGTAEELRAMAATLSRGAA